MRKIVIIPAYNEEGNILKVVEDIRENAPDYDYIVVNDCSTDSTYSICCDNDINCLNLPVNLGIGGAVQSGYLYAYRNGYDLAVQFDGDGQHSAKYLHAMEREILDNRLDMCIGSRFITNEGFQSSALRRLGIKHFTMLIKALTGVTITDPTSGMRMVNRDIIEIYSKDYPQDYPEPESVVHILVHDRRVKEIPVIMNERSEGVSSISPGKSVYYMIKVTLAIVIAFLRR